MHRKNKILLFAILAGSSSNSSSSSSMLVAGQQSTRLLKKGGAGGGGSTTTVATVCPETAFERQLLVNVIGRPEDVTATELSILEQEFASSYNTLGSLTCPGVRTIQEVTIQLESGTASTSTVAVNKSSTRSFSFRFQVHGICRRCIKPNLFMNYTIRSLKTMTVHQSGSGARRGIAASGNQEDDRSPAHRFLMTTKATQSRSMSSAVVVTAVQCPECNPPTRAAFATVYDAGVQMLRISGSIQSVDSIDKVTELEAPIAANTSPPSITIPAPVTVGPVMPARPVLLLPSTMVTPAPITTPTIPPSKAPSPPTIPPSIFLTPDLELICAWMSLSPTVCPTVSFARRPRTTATGTIPTQIGLLTSLTTLDLTRNALIGSIPTQIWELTNLTTLYLSANALIGTVPTQMGLLTSLSSLSLSGNALTGTIPTQIGLLTSLTALYLPANALTGTIPTQIGQLTSLTVLDLSYNALTGTIPTQIGLLRSLLYLQLDNNALTGTIPSTQIERLMSLTYLQLQNNALSAGTIPSLLCILRGFAYIDCDKITKCSCCICSCVVGG